MIEHTYTEPVSKLLMLGRPNGQEWPDYLQMEFTRADIPELIRLLEDKKLRWMEKPEDLPEDEDLIEWYGQIYAWRTLAQLKAEEAIPALLNTLQEIDEHQDDWYGEDSFKVFPMIGPAAIHPLAEYLADTKHGTWARVAASSSLENMAKAHPETKEECVTAIVSTLQKYKDNDESLNGSMISALMEMNAAREHLGLIEEAFKANRVDTFIDGDLEDIQIRLGVIEKRRKPRSHPILFKDDRIFVDNNHPIIKKAVKKEKNKRKQEKKSRKKNRKR
jgi:hypothetical protein